jgi:hypothetical protein
MQPVSDGSTDPGSEQSSVHGGPFTCGSAKMHANKGELDGVRLLRADIVDRMVRNALADPILTLFRYCSSRTPDASTVPSSVPVLVRSTG